MLLVAAPGARPLRAARPGVAPVVAPIGAPAACVEQRMENDVSRNEANSQGVAFETWMSEQPWNRGPEDRVKRVRAGFCARRRPDRFWPNRICGGGNCLRTVAKVPGGRNSLVCRLNVWMGREADGRDVGYLPFSGLQAHSIPLRHRQMHHRLPCLLHDHLSHKPAMAGGMIAFET
jgi:hypothetical protein